MEERHNPHFSRPIYIAGFLLLLLSLELLVLVFLPYFSYTVVTGTGMPSTYRKERFLL